jgi:hypothetical protein
LTICKKNFKKEVFDMKLRFILFLTILALSCGWGFADEHNEGEVLPRVTNEVYKENCGACHIAFQPGLLPARSWINILDNPGVHAGGELSFDKTTKDEIRKYLTQNSAEKSRSEISREIVASIGSDIPSRISEVPFIRKEHQEIKKEVFSRSAVGSRGNCIACHRTAEQGYYDDDNVTIPK